MKRERSLERPATGTKKGSSAWKRRIVGMSRLTASAALLWAGTAVAAPPANQVSLNNCQNAVKAAAATFAKNKIAAVSTCLQKISSDIIKLNGSISTTTAKVCVSQLRKIVDSRAIGRSLEEKKAVKIEKKCDPGMPLVTHTLGDVTGIAPTVPQPIDAKNIGAWCQNFGGDGTVNTLEKWIDCIDKAHECAADLAISVQYPRALEWFGLLNTAISSLPAPPATDPNLNTDALAALEDLRSAIDGPDDDGVPSMQCGKAPPAVCSTTCCYQEFSLGAQVSCFEYTGTAAEVGTFTGNCDGKTSTPPGAWTMSAGAGACGNPPDFPAHVACPALSTVVIPQDSSCP